MLVRVRQHHAFEPCATGREGDWNRRGKRRQRRILLGKPPPVEVSKSWPCERLSALNQECSKDLGDCARICASPTVEEVPAQVVDRTSVQQALSSSWTARLVGGGLRDGAAVGKRPSRVHPGDAPSKAVCPIRNVQIVRLSTVARYSTKT